MLEFQAFFALGPAQALSNRSRQPPGPPRAIAKELLLGGTAGAQQLAGFGTQAAQDAGAVSEQATIGRILNVRLDHGPVSAQFAAVGHAEFLP